VYTAHAEIVTPLPDFNVADRNSRWNYFTADTLPAYLTLLHQHPDQMHYIMDTPLPERIDQQRLSNRIDDILAQLSHWSVKVEH
jgi:hypothetical protein